MKLPPVTVNTTVRLPAGALEGEIVETLGTGLFEEEEEEELPPPHPVARRANVARQTMSQCRWA